ncbi:MAG: tripartite tricarboxylate transporter permease [Methanocorpusculum sp.]|nr:tripartite tricarboxylate transporter permease [Methanocorpusculum sp.]
MLNLVLGTLAGCIVGCITGIVPGLHSNTAAGAAAALAVPLSFVFGVEGVCCMIVSLMVVHTFTDCIPSTFIGVPDPDTVLSVLPAHRMYLEGNGAAAVRISALGSLFGFVFCLPLFALFYFVLPQFQGEIDWAIGLIVLLAATLLIVFSRAPLWSLLLFLVSGGVGVFGMYFSYLSFGCFGMGEVLLPLLSGLFGIPILLLSLKRPGTVVPQVFSGLGTKRGEILKSSLKGTFAGAVVGWLPGFSSGTANAVLAIRKHGIHFDEGRPHGYLLSTSAANTANAVLGIAALYAVGRMRSGSMAVLAEFNLPSLPLMLAAAGCAAVVGYFVVVLLSKTGTFAAKIPQKTLALAALFLLIVLTAVLCGPFGIFLLVISTAAGLIPELTGISRLYCMGSIMIPVMLFTLGILTF